MEKPCDGTLDDCTGALDFGAAAFRSEVFKANATEARVRVKSIVAAGFTPATAPSVPESIWFISHDTSCDAVWSGAIISWQRRQTNDPSSKAEGENIVSLFPAVVAVDGRGVVCSAFTLLISDNED